MISKSNLITAWIIYDKGMIPDCGTGENQRPATDEEVQEAGLQIEEYLQIINQPILDKDMVDDLKTLEDWLYRKKSMYVPDGIAIVNRLRIALSNKDKKIEENYNTIANQNSEIADLYELQSKLNVIEVIVNDVSKRSRYNLIEDLYNANDEIKQILGNPDDTR